MDSLVVLTSIKECINSKLSFVVHGGAGSGKTQVLKETIEYLRQQKLDSRLLCITHTNIAADEIRNRVDSSGFVVCTIHSFLNSLCSGYKKNIKQTLPEYFTISELKELDISKFENEQTYKKKKHEAFKKHYKKLAKSVFELNGTVLPVVVGKREFDKDPENYCGHLNSLIDEFNVNLISYFDSIDSKQVGYNESKFDNLLKGTYGHDGLIKMATLLLNKYEKLRKILQDRFEYILIDEYQDSNGDLIELLVDIEPGIIVGLFGDSMQGIYGDAIGDAHYLCEENKIREIKKSDNFRCSEQVVKFINTLRLDSLEQKVQLKQGETSINERQGSVKLYYSILKNPKPSLRSSLEVKSKYYEQLEETLERVLTSFPDYKVLLLTNKTVAQRVGFEILHKVFSDRYLEANEKLKNFCEKSNLLDLCKMIHNYKAKKFNYVISELRKNGFEINNLDDKAKVKLMFNKLENVNLSFWEAIDFGIESNLIPESKFLTFFIARSKETIHRIESESNLKEFLLKFEEGHNTFTRMSKVMNIGSEVEFNKNLSLIKQKRFYESLTSDEILLSEVRNYHSYLEEETSFITMHKTKGASIENVIVVSDNYFWNEYDFSLVYETSTDENALKHITSKKLFYVACSRCISNLIVVQLFEDEVDRVTAERFDELIRI